MSPSQAPSHIISHWKIGEHESPPPTTTTQRRLHVVHLYFIDVEAKRPPSPITNQSHPSAASAFASTSSFTDIPHLLVYRKTAIGCPIHNYNNSLRVQR